MKIDLSKLLKGLEALPKTSRMVDRIAGLTIGSVMRNMVFHLGVSRMVAASSRFASMLRKIPPIRM